MADNVTITSGANSTPPAGTVVAADEVTINATAVKVQRVKIGTGVDGTYDGDVSDSNPLPINDAGGSLTVDANNLDIRDLTSSSDSIAAVQSGTWNIVNVSGTVSLPTGASTEATLSAASAKLPATLGQKAKTASMSVVLASDSDAIPITDNSGSLTVDGTVTANAGTGTFTTKETRSSTATSTNVSDTASSTTILASNANRLGATVYNDSTAVLYLKLGATASITSFTAKMAADSYYEVPFNYTGIIDGIWASDASGAARIVELT